MAFQVLDVAKVLQGYQHQGPYEGPHQLFMGVGPQKPSSLTPLMPTGHEAALLHGPSWCFFGETVYCVFK